jgi:hypothetical protein
MHEFKHGELKTGLNGRGGHVKSRSQAIAIALEEAGASRYESGSRNRRNLRRTENKEAQGRTAQQEREGKSHVGASRKRESTKPWLDARKLTARTKISYRPLAKARGHHSAGALHEGKAQGNRRPFPDEQAAVGKRARYALR